VAGSGEMVIEQHKVETDVVIFDEDNMSELCLPSSRRDSILTPSVSSREASPCRLERPESPLSDDSEPSERQEAHGRPLLEAFLGALQAERRSCRARPLPPRGSAHRRRGSRGWGLLEPGPLAGSAQEEPGELQEARWQDTFAAILRAESSAVMARKLPRRRPNRPVCVIVTECREEELDGEDALPMPSFRQRLWSTLRSELAPKRKPRGRQGRRDSDPAPPREFGPQCTPAAKLVEEDPWGADTLRKAGVAEAPPGMLRRSFA